MEQEHKEALRQANFRRAYCCKKCGSPELIERDGASMAFGMPGIKYKQCQACGFADPMVKRQGRKRNEL